MIDSTQSNEADAFARLGHRLTLTVPEVAAMLGISRSTAYVAARQGQLPTLRLGRRLVVSVPALIEMLRRQGNDDSIGVSSSEASGDDHA
jgi:excisionase family DNA binding protein